MQRQRDVIHVSQYGMSPLDSQGCHIEPFVMVVVPIFPPLHGWNLLAGELLLFSFFLFINHCYPMFRKILNESSVAIKFEFAYMTL